MKRRGEPCGSVASKLLGGQVPVVVWIDSSTGYLGPNPLSGVGSVLGKDSVSIKSIHH